jgi:hypothetical protein
VTVESIVLFLLIVGGLLFWLQVLGAVAATIASARRRPAQRKPLDECMWRDCPMAVTSPGHRRVDHGRWIPRPR